MIRKIRWKGSKSWSISASRPWGKSISTSWGDNWAWSVSSDSNGPQASSWTTFNSHGWVWAAIDMNLPVSESWSKNA